MKNFHKVRGKREFLFDDRELIVLGSGAAIICLLIFILGLMVGQTFSEQSVAQTMPAEVAVVAGGNDTELAASFESESPAEFSSGDSETLEAEAPEEAAETKKADQSYFTVLPDKESYVEVEATPVRDAEPEPEASPPEATGAAPELAAAPQPATPVPPSAAGNTQSGQQQATAAAPSLPNVPRDPSDSIQVGRRPANMNAPLAPGTAIYSVQVASSPKLEDSERLVRKFGERGYQAYIMQADLGDKGIWFRVRVGNLPSRAEALIIKAELEEKLPDLANSPYVIKVSE
jgi:cell division septation protein DedD